MSEKKYFFIVNPTARSHPNDLCDRIRGRFPNSPVESTKCPGDATRLTHLALEYTREADDVVVACGGDGTFREVAQCVGGKRQLAIIPSGTVNQIPAQLSIPTGLDEALETVAAGKAVPVYPGLAAFDGATREEMFFIGVSAGLDAEVVHMVSPTAKKLIGELAYGLAFLKRALRPLGNNVRVTFGGANGNKNSDAGDTTEALLCAQAIALSNGLYGGKFRFTDALTPQTPGLAVAAARGGMLSALSFFISAMRRRAGGSTKISGIVKHVGGDTVRMELLGDNEAFQIDGDPVSAKYATLRGGNEPLRVLVPHNVAGVADQSK